MILDHIEKLELPTDGEDYLFDAQMTLARLSQGLFWLYEMVAQAESRVRQRGLKENVVLGLVNGVLENEQTDFLSCAFQWYAVSAYNYVRLVGWIAKQDPDFMHGYIRRVIPRITEYRHKVAAHFAITAPHDDNQADRQSSIITNVVYAGGHLRAGAVSETLTDAQGNEIQAENKTSWSLTKSHANLVPRYWPNGPLQTFQSIKLSAGAKRTFHVDWKD